jgi:pimeloyl-ACP methyl ester carboxylesterase/DNA-binding CsgD family transcriptional regulator
MAIWGSGSPIVGVLAHIGDHLDAPGVAARHWCQALSRHQSFVRFDGRGCGLSDRCASAISLASCLEDVGAVVDALGQAPVTLFGISQAAAIAVEFAAFRPRQVGRLVIYGGFARGRLKRGVDAAHAKEAQAILDVLQVAYGEEVPYRAAFRRTLNTRFFPSATAEQLDEVDAAAASRLSADVATAYMTMLHEIDVSESARRLTCPALLFHARRDPLVPFDEGRYLASLIPAARFVPLDDGDHLPLETNAHWPLVLGELQEFLGWPRDVATTSTGSNLTRRQIDVLRLISQGHTDKEIARVLGLSPRTVEMHASLAMRALVCKSRSEAVHLATRLGLLG